MCPTKVRLKVKTKYPEPCKAGHFMTEGGCQQCGENTYSGAGASFCTRCPEGKVSKAGSKSARDCQYGRR